MVSEIEESATNASAYESDAWYNYTNDITEILDTRSGKMTNYSTLRIEEDNYRLTDSRLNAVLGTLFEYLGMNPAINKLLDSLKAQQLLDLVNSLLLKENGADLSSGDIGNVVSQLLYGYNNGKGGETTGLALPAQYLFGNLNFTSKEVYKSTGKNAFKVGATADEVVYVTTYKDSGEVNDDGSPVLTATITREAFDNATMKQPPKTSAEIVPGQKYTTGDTYAKTKLGTAYTAYKTKLESDNKNPNTAALVDIIKSLQPALGLVGGLLNLNDIIGGLVPGLDVSAILKAIAPDLDLNAILTQILGKIDLTGVTVEGVQNFWTPSLANFRFTATRFLKSAGSPTSCPTPTKHLPQPPAQRSI